MTNLTGSPSDNEDFIKTNNSEGDPSLWPAPPFDQHTFFLIDVILHGVITGLIAACGIVTNIINVIIFYRQGIFSESSNVSLTALAVSDFFACFFAFFVSVYVFILHFLWTPDSDWDAHAFSVMTATRPKTIFCQITCWMTAYIAFERFMNVVFPFKVKYILTPKRSFICVCVIFVLTILLYYPQYMTFYPAWTRTSDNTTSKLEYVSTGLVNDDMRQTFIVANPIVFRMISMLIVVICNIAMIWKMKMTMRFRKPEQAPEKVVNQNLASTSSKIDNMGIHNGAISSSIKSQREMRLLRMITIICITFIICFIPDSFFVGLFYVGTKLRDDSPQYHPYVQETAHSVGEFFETVNSSINIIIYYTMSTRYKQKLDGCFLGKANSPSSDYSRSIDLTASTADNL